MSFKRKVLFIGLGSIGQRHLRNLRTIMGDSVEVHAYRARRQTLTLTDRLEVEPNVNLETKYGIHIHTDIQSVLDLKPEMAFVCNPSSLHIDMAHILAHAGIHLFIEKPLSHNLQDVRSLVDKVESKGLTGYVGYQMRFHPVINRLHQIIKEGLIGKILAGRVDVGEYLPHWHKYEDYRTMYASRSDLGGGVVLSQIHELDYLYWFFGLPQRVYSVGGHLSSLKIDVEDVVSSLLEFEVQNQIIPIHLHQDYLQHPSSRGGTFIGDEGKVVFDLTRPGLHRYDKSGNRVEFLEFPEFQRNTLFMDEMHHFLNCVKDGCAPLISLRGGADSLRMALAIKCSLANRRIVELSEFSF